MASGDSREDTLVRHIKELGVPTALVIYFLYKDYVFTDQLVSLLTKIELIMKAGGLG